MGKPAIGASDSRREDMIVFVGSDLLCESDQTTEAMTADEAPQQSPNGSGTAGVGSLSTEEAQQEALKKIGNVARYPLNRESLIDRYEVGRSKLKNIIEDRGRELETPADGRFDLLT